MLSLLLAGALTAGGFGPGSLVCTLSDPRITESSGIVVSARSDDTFYTHNDSGDVARFFELDRSCRTVATVSLPGVQARDWEDISRGPGATLWLGDIGDNSGIRDRGILVHEVPEPAATARGTVRETPVSYRLRYPDGPHDAEALLVHPRTGQLIVVTKSFAGGNVYVAQLPLQPDRPNVLRRTGRIAVPEVTAGDISPDGRHVIVRNYTAAYEWDVHGDDVVAALRGEPTRVRLPASPQGEGISYTSDGQGLVVSSEGQGSLVQELRRTPPPVAASPRAVTLHRVGSLWWVVLVGAGLVLLGGLVGLGITRRHHR